MRAVVLFLSLLLASSACAQEKPPGFGGRMTRFGGGIWLGDYARAKLSGNAVAAEAAKSAPAMPEFLTSLLMFDTSLRLGEKALSKVPGKALAGVVKHNLALGTAMALGEAVQVDFGGFRYSDGLKGDFSALQDTTVRLNGVDAQGLGITVGVFAVWGPAYAGLKRGGAHLAQRTGGKAAAKRVAAAFGRAVAKRFIRTAAVKGVLSALPVPGSRIVALAVIAVDVALAIGDTAILLQTARLIEEPIHHWNDHRKARVAVREQAEEAERLAKEGTAAELTTALGATASKFDAYRNLVYSEVSLADQQLLQVLRQKGFPQDVLNELASRAYNDYGEGLALPALSALLVEGLQTRLDAARAGEGELGMDPDELERLLQAHREHVGELLQEVGAEFGGAFQTERSFLERLRQQVAHDPAKLAAVEQALERLETHEVVTAMLLEPLGGGPQGAKQPPAAIEQSNFISDVTSPPLNSGLGITHPLNRLGRKTP